MLGFGLNGGSKPLSPITDILTGFDQRGTFQGGPTRVLDSLGVLTTSPANVLPVPGGRLSYSLAEGATLGPELLASPEDRDFNSDSGNWVKGTGVTVSNGALNFTGSAAGGTYHASVTTFAGRVYQSSYRVSAYTSGSFYVLCKGTRDASLPTRTGVGTYVDTIVAGATGSGWYFNVVASPFYGSIDDVSFREVIPIWLPTAANGSQLWPSQSVRTRKGSVQKFDSTFMGMLNEPARTQLLFPSAAPVVQNITTTAQQYTVSCIGSGSLTLSGSATGVATQASPLTVTATAGTLTVTPSGTLTHGQVEVGAFKTSPITSVSGTVTRPASNYTRATANVLRANDWGIWGRVVPLQAPVDNVLLSTTETGATYFMSIQIQPGSIRLRKYVAGSQIGVALAAFASSVGVPFEYQAFQSSAYGMGLRVKQDGGAWSAWVLQNDANGRAVCPIGVALQIGARLDVNHFAGNFPFTAIVMHADPKTYLESLAARYP